MGRVLLTTGLLLLLLAFASLGCAVLSPTDTAAWAISETSAALGILFAYFYAAGYAD